MIVCHCMVVRDDEIRTEVRLGATSVDTVRARCGAASRCGGCEQAVAHVVADELARAEHGDLARH